MNICVFASGAGSNFHSLIRSAEEGYLSSKISLLITNNSACGAVSIAKEHGIEFLHISRKKFDSLSEECYAELLLREMTSRNIDFAVLCGYMKLVPAKVLTEFKDCIINIHPALLPSFGGKGMYGLNVHRAVIESGVKVSGISVHFVDGEYDRGRIIFQKCCDVAEDDDEHSLERKIKALEHKYYSEVVRKFEEGKVVLKGHKVFLH